MTIPDDVMKTATAAWLAGSAMAIARAIMADRESRWQPIETAPKDGTEILVVRDNGCGWDYGTVWWTGRQPYPWSAGFNEYPEDKWDGWMPLPTPPKGGDNEAD